jgi:hypothetical protein
MNARFLDRFTKPTRNSVLALALDGNRLDGMVLARSNGSIVIQHAFSFSLALDPLASDPELAGRDIRKQLDSAGVRERRCTVCLPLNWVLTHTVKLPELPEADQTALLQTEAERHFPYSPEELVIAINRFKTPEGELGALLTAVQREHVVRLDSVLSAAKLKPVAFSLGIIALPLPPATDTHTHLTLLPGENSVGLLISRGEGLIALRSIEGAFDTEDNQKRIQVDPIAREVRITLGQLAPALQKQVRRLRVFGDSESATLLAQQLAPKLASMGISVEQVKLFPPDEAPCALPPSTIVSPALSLGLRHLTRTGPQLQFLPPKVSAWQQATKRYSSRKLVYSGATAGAVVLVVLAAFIIQQWQLARWQARWSNLAPRVAAVDNLQQQIKKFRPWYDESFRTLSIIKKLTEAFPEDGSVSVKTVEIRDLSLVTCSGTARDNQALLRTLDKLRAMRELNNSVQVEQIRGRTPMQFTFNFRWSDRSTQ